MEDKERRECLIEYIISYVNEIEDLRLLDCVRILAKTLAIE